ncbi:MAG: PQQ-binding-like beta-propeller repeat protein [Alphaproteobacteria bacterium]|nr:PQQ-binding-like beta-propeller repeat protein [Alphaproteobacteria bacterium]
MNRMAVLFLAALCALAVASSSGNAQKAPAEPAGLGPDETAQAVRDFNGTCASCHGDNGGGGDRGPALHDNPHLRTLDADGIAAIITNGQRGMPSFASLPKAQIARLAAWIHSMNISGLQSAPPQQVASGEAYFFGAGGCSGCHMVHGRGASSGPDLSAIAARSTRAEMEKWLDNPTAMMGVKSDPACPGWAFCPDFQWAVQDVTLKSGEKLRGFARRQTEHQIALQTLKGEFRMLYAPQIASVVREKQSYMPVYHGSTEQRRDLLAYLGTLGGIDPGPLNHSTAPISQADIDAIMNPKLGNWVTYNGKRDGNHYSPLDQINTGNVKQLQPQWAFVPGGVGLEGEPIVKDDIMYVTGGPQVCALDARTGLRTWCSPRTNGVGVQKAARRAGAAIKIDSSVPVGPNRGVGILGDRLFYTSDDAYIVCLNRLTGAVMWTQPLAESSEKGRIYTSASVMVVDDLVITGIAGGDGPMRGFIVAYHADTGKEAWRFYTIPRPGEPLSETWKGRALETGGGATWETGSYDPETRTLFWAVGNPYPDTDPSERGGTNLYTNSVVALDAKTGKLKWHYQFVPYDTHDWDATEPMVLADTMWQGKPRKLLMTAQRSGVFYVLDRTNGQFLLAKPFVKKITWVDGFDPKTGSPHLVPGNVPTEEGVKTCPGVRGATNWYPTAFDPQTRLFYVMAAEDCGIYRSKGRIFGNNPDPSDPGLRLVRALNIETGDIVWEKPMPGPQETDYSGVLATGGGLLFHGDVGGNFAGVDARTGKTLYNFRTNDSWRATPMTYTVDGRQYVAGMAGQVLWSFALGYK